MTQPLLEASNITLLRGDSAVLRRLSLTVHAGTAMHLTGENGSGKTTLLHILAGTLPPTAGTVTRHASLLYLGHKPGIKALLTVEENLTSAAVLYHHMPKKNLKPRIETALNAVGIAHLAGRQCRHLSAGQARRVQLARLWLDAPPLWLLDEPLTALDTASAANLSARIAEHLQTGGSAVITSHQRITIPNIPVQKTALSDLQDCTVSAQDDALL